MTPPARVRGLSLLLGLFAASLLFVPSAAAGPDEGLYAPEAVHETYAGLLERARPVLASGRVAVLDATWSLRAERRRVHGQLRRVQRLGDVVQLCCG